MLETKLCRWSSSPADWGVVDLPLRGLYWTDVNKIGHGRREIFFCRMPPISHFDLSSYYYLLKFGKFSGTSKKSESHSLHQLGGPHTLMHNTKHNS